MVHWILGSPIGFSVEHILKMSWGLLMCLPLGIHVPRCPLIGWCSVPSAAVLVLRSWPWVIPSFPTGGTEQLVSVVKCCVTWLLPVWIVQAVTSIAAVEVRWTDHWLIWFAIGGRLVSARPALPGSHISSLPSMNRSGCKLVATSILGTAGAEAVEPGTKTLQQGLGGQLGGSFVEGVGGSQVQGIAAMVTIVTDAGSLGPRAPGPTAMVLLLAAPLPAGDGWWVGCHSGDHNGDGDGSTQEGTEAQTQQGLGVQPVGHMSPD